MTSIYVCMCVCVYVYVGFCAYLQKIKEVPKLLGEDSFLYGHGNN